MSKKTIIVVVIILLVIALFWFIPKSSVLAPSYNNNPTTTTPKDTTPTGGTTTSGNVSAKLGQTITLSGVTGTLTELVADSRCPVDVQCIQAGTVQVKVHFSYGLISQDATLTLGEMLTLYGHSITLTTVTPEKRSGVTIVPADYVFTFLIK